ncbi:MAG: N-acetylmuramoyl-L-alanine amidase [Oscillospiraceae bacterium]|jgi:N-acetylmuramoyl-L-alanine amidase|nr:N-acetylmuramoyl-L-alanine amidase [Oscillospiraceae bacterium]
MEGTRRGWRKALGLCSAACCAAALALVAWGNLRARPAQPAPAPPAGPLSGRVVAVDAGHGGYDGGAVGGATRVLEKDLNLDVALRLRDLLTAQGAQVLLTRDGDYALCDEDPLIRKKLQDMQRRAALVASGGAELLLSIHMNEYADRRQSGPQVFHRPRCPAGRLLAETLQQCMNDTLQPSRARTVQAGDYYVLTLGLPAALVECGFLSNRAEEALLQSADYRQRIAQSVCEGVLAWFALDERPQALAAQQR